MAGPEHSRPGCYGTVGGRPPPLAVQQTCLLPGSRTTSVPPAATVLKAGLPKTIRVCIGQGTSLPLFLSLCGFFLPLPSQPPLLQALGEQLCHMAPALPLFLPPEAKVFQPYSSQSGCPLPALVWI